MFCLYSSCPAPAGFFPLRRPVPSWSSPPLPPPAGIAGALLQEQELRPGSQDSPPPPGEQHTESPSTGENSSGHRLSFPPSRTSSPPSIGRRPGSAGQAAFHFSSGSSLKGPPFKAGRHPEFRSQLDRVAATPDYTGSSDDVRPTRKTDSPEIRFGTEIPEQWTNDAGEMEYCIRNDHPDPEDRSPSPFRHVFEARLPNARSLSCCTVTPPPKADDGCPPRPAVSARLQRCLPSPLHGSPAPSSPKTATLKFGIDSILRTDGCVRLSNEGENEI